MKPQKRIRGYEIAGRMPLFQKWGRDAIREDRKTMTRRLNGLKKINERPDEHAKAIELCDDTWSFWFPGNVSEEAARRFYPTGGGFKCPWKVGEYRVMTEPLRRGGAEKEGVILYYNDPNRDVIYDDTGDLVYSNLADNLLDWRRWKRDTLSAMFMPYEAARTICQITNIKVERVQDLKSDELEKEGLDPWRDYEGGQKYSFVTMRNDFHRLWDSINKKRGYGWDQNNWVFVLKFKRV